MAFDKRKSLQSALTYSQQGKWDKAIAEYQTILKADPNDLTVCNNLGDLYARVGKASEAIEQYLKLGELYRADGLSVKAIAVYKKIIKLDGNRTQALLACADLYEEQGLTGEAKIQLTFVAEQFSKAGDTARVIEIYQRLAVLDQTNHPLLTKLGDLLLKSGKREEAAAQYELAAQAAEAAGKAAEAKRLRAKLPELTPSSPQVNLAQAEQLLRDGKHADAVEALLKATATENTNARAWGLLGEAYVGVGQGSEAITALEQAVELGLAEKEVRRPLAKALILEGRSDEGMTLCQQLAEDALAQKAPDAAITICQEISALAPNLASVHVYLVHLLQGLGRDEQVRIAMRDLAAAHEASGQIENAIQVYRQLLQSEPSDTEAKARLEALEGLSVASSQSVEGAVPGLETVPTVEEPAVQASEPVEAESAEPTATEVEPAALPPGELAETEASSAEPPALELSDETLTLSDLNALGLGEGIESGSQPTQVFELDETGELAGVRYARQDPHSPSTELDGPAIEFPEVLPTEEAQGPQTPEEEEKVPGEVAELLAEAEVYLKYGLIEKARERLLEVIAHAPENLTAHRRLKTLYLDRPQAEGACEEVLAIARILQSRGRLDAAQQELQEGLRRAPGNKALQEMLFSLSGTGVQEVAHSEAGLDVPEALEAQGEAVQVDPGEHALTPEAQFTDAAPSEGMASDGAPVELPGLGGEATPPEEELPPEFRSFLEEPAEGTTQVLQESPGDVDQAMTDDLAEASFYLSQRMLEEARAVHRRMRARDATHPAVAQLKEQIGLAPTDAALETVASAPPELPATEEAVSFADLLEDADPTPQEKPVEGSAAQPPSQIPAPQTVGQPKFSVIQGRGEAGADGYVNLGAELQEELAAEEGEVPSETGAPPVEEILRQFQKGVREHLDEKDFETHYNLGIAYKEMELYDEAIPEFRLAARDPGRTLACADLLGLCYLAKTDPTEAIREFRIGLEVRGHPPESYYDIRYDLAVAHETSGDWERALELFEALQADDEQFRDVSARVKQLRERLLRPVTSTSSPPLPKTAPEPTKGARGKRISFI